MLITDLRAVPHHLPQLAAWHHREWGYLHPGRREAELAEEMREYLGEAAIPRMFVAECDGQVVGSAALIACDMDTHPELGPWLANVYVEATRRGQGVGMRLVRTVMDYAAELGQPRLYLFTPSQEAFYLSLGWTTLAQEPYHGAPVTLMAYRPPRREDRA